VFANNFINDIYDKKRDMTCGATEFRAMAHAVDYQDMGEGFGLCGFELLFHHLDYHTTWTISLKHFLDSIPFFFPQKKKKKKKRAQREHEQQF
jgi:hypothetical protein